MITQDFLSQCSDEQINKGVAWIEAMSGDDTIYVHPCDAWFSSVINYCSNPKIIMPIAFGNKIDIRHDYETLGSVTALIGDEDDYLYWVTNQNPYRAICEVYILMSVNK